MNKQKEKINKKPVLIFDVFKTLILFDGDHVDNNTYDFIAKWLTYRGYPVSSEKVKELYKEYYEVHLSKSNSPFPDVDAFNVWKDILSVVGIKDNLDEFSKEVCLIWRQITTHHIEIYPRTIEMLESCQKAGFKLVVASNTQRAYTEYELAMLGLDSYFEAIYFSSDFGVCKPDRTFFEKVLLEIGEIPSNVMYIGDNPFDDVKGALTLDIPTILLERGTVPKTKEELPEPYVTIFNNKVEKVAVFAKEHFLIKSEEQD